MWGSIGYVVHEPDVTEDFRQFLIIMYGSSLTYQTLIVEQLYILITDYGRLTSRMERAWLNQFNFWIPSPLRAQLNGLAESGGFLRHSKPSGFVVGGAGLNCVTFFLYSTSVPVLR